MEGTSLMTCVVQQNSTNFFLTPSVSWTSDLSNAAEFKNLREAITFQSASQVPDAHVLVFHERKIYRVDGHRITRPIV